MFLPQSILVLFFFFPSYVCIPIIYIVFPVLLHRLPSRINLLNLQFLIHSPFVLTCSIINLWFTVVAHKSHPYINICYPFEQYNLCIWCFPEMPILWPSRWCCFISSVMNLLLLNIYILLPVLCMRLLYVCCNYLFNNIFKTSNYTVWPSVISWNYIVISWSILLSSQQPQELLFLLADAGYHM